jgi:predicted aspartyl protease
MAQETRIAIFGRVSDAQGAAVPDATLEVTNTGTNVSIAVHANETGYFEANLLIAGLRL